MKEIMEYLKEMDKDSVFLDNDELIYDPLIDYVEENFEEKKQNLEVSKWTYLFTKKQENHYVEYETGRKLVLPLKEKTN